MNRSRRLWLVVWLVVVGSAAAHAQKAASRPATAQATLPVRWVFDIKRDKNENPSGSVYLQVGGKRHHILAASSAFEVVPRDRYKDYKIPAYAIAACAGWWAGAGDDLYVVRRGRQLDVYWRSLDEQANTPPYKRIKSIRLAR